MVRQDVSRASVAMAARTQRTVLVRLRTQVQEVLRCPNHELTLCRSCPYEVLSPLTDASSAGHQVMQSRRSSQRLRSR
jgi:hypothetical protein